ncbi:MAG: hypothetical protein KF906_09735 [Actinobacteria bacterium]|nr:hypothetical protein [Actinomycetota bacterium]
MDEALSGAIEELYQRFGRYDLPAWTDPCMHCHSEADEARLHRAPVRELTVEDLDRYSADALLVWGDETTFRPLLPRLFELAALGPVSDLTDPADVIGTLGRCGWTTWPDDERVAIRRYLDAWWRDRLERADDSFEMRAALVALAEATDDVAPFLRVLDDPPSTDALRNTARLILAARFTGPPLGEARDRHPNATEQIRSWLDHAAPALRDRFGRTAAAATETGDDATFDLMTTASSAVARS